MQIFRKVLLTSGLLLLPMLARGQAHPVPEVPHVEQEIPREGQERQPSERRPEEQMKEAEGKNFEVQAETGEKFETKEERRKEQEELSGHITGTPEEMARVWDSLLTRRLAELTREPTPVVVWKRVVNPNGTVKYDAYLKDGTAPSGERWLSADGLHALENGGRPVVHEGEIPSGAEWGAKWEAFTGLHRNLAVHVPESANREPHEIAEATALGTLVLQPARVKIFNALPNERTAERSAVERRRMGLERTGTVEDWSGLNDRIRKSTEGTFQMQTATRQAVLEELRHGSSDDILLYAHHSKGRIYLGGADTKTGDGMITLEDLAGIVRRGDPAVAHRRIVLVACRTADVGEAGSIARKLLQNGIARTVFATDKPYDAREIPALLERLKSQSLQQGGGQLKQYVRLEAVPIFSASEREADEQKN